MKSVLGDLQYFKFYSKMIGQLNPNTICQRNYFPDKEKIHDLFKRIFLKKEGGEKNVV